jgi:hypothetical protein
MRFIDFPNQNETLNNLTETKGVLGTVNNARMLYFRGLEAEKIRIVSEYHASLRKPEGSLLSILGLDQSDFLRGGHVDVATAKPIGDGGVATLIQVETNRPSHWPS